MEFPHRDVLCRVVSPRPGRSPSAPVIRYGGTPGPRTGPQLQGVGRESESVQCPVGGRDLERPHGLLAEHAVQGVRELRPEGHGPADAGPPRGGIHEGDPERRPEPGVGLRRQRDRRRHDPFGRGREMPVVRGGPGPRQGVAEPRAEDEQRPFDDERELGLGPADGRFTTALPRRRSPGSADDSRGDTGSPPPRARGCRAGVCAHSRRSRDRPSSPAAASDRRFGRHRAGRSRLTSPQQAGKPVAAIRLRIAIHVALRRLPSVPDQS